MRPEYWGGEVQAAGREPSSEHWEVAPRSFASNEGAALV